MRRKVLVIGIGAGNPEHVTIQAVEAMNRADVLFIPHKGAEKAELAALRRTICDRYIRGAYRTVAFDVPERDRSADDYHGAVDRWHAAVADVYRDMLAGNLGAGECGAFLVWGDPALYDSTLRVLDRLAGRPGSDLDWEVIPGISAVQALAAAHRVVLNDIGGPVAITTGRKLREGFPAEADSVVVMLDQGDAFRAVGEDVDIWWGAYLGTGDEVLVSGRLADVADDISRIRREARAAKGWIMDTYLMKRRPKG